MITNSVRPYANFNSQANSRVAFGGTSVTFKDDTLNGGEVTFKMPENVPPGNFVKDFLGKIGDAWQDFTKNAVNDSIATVTDAPAAATETSAPAVSAVALQKPAHAANDEIKEAQKAA